MKLQPLKLLLAQEQSHNWKLHPQMRWQLMRLRLAHNFYEPAIAHLNIWLDFEQIYQNVFYTLDLPQPTPQSKAVKVR